MNKKNINTLVNLNDALNDTDVIAMANNAKISNPSKEVEESLVNFVKKRLNKISEDNDFETIIKNNIRQRLPEASFEQLTELLHNVQMDNTEASNGITSMFKNEQSGKTLIDSLKDDSAKTAANALYNSTEDKSVLQAVTYLGQVMAQMKEKEMVNITPNEEESSD